MCHHVKPLRSKSNMDTSIIYQKGEVESEERHIASCIFTLYYYFMRLVLIGFYVTACFAHFKPHEYTRFFFLLELNFPNPTIRALCFMIFGDTSWVSLINILDPAPERCPNWTSTTTPLSHTFTSFIDRLPKDFIESIHGRTFNDYNAAKLDFLDTFCSSTGLLSCIAAL
jgi:hypothetical protein